MKLWVRKEKLKNNSYFGWGVDGVVPIPIEDKKLFRKYVWIYHKDYSIGVLKPFGYLYERLVYWRQWFTWDGVFSIKKEPSGLTISDNALTFKTLPPLCKTYNPKKGDELYKKFCKYCIEIGYFKGDNFFGFVFAPFLFAPFIWGYYRIKRVVIWTQ